MKISEEDLQPRRGRPARPDTDGDVLEVAAPNDFRKGIDNVLARLELTLGDQKSVRRGISMNDFFRERTYHRRNGERVADWITRWDEGIARLEEDGVDLMSIDDLNG